MAASSSVRTSTAATAYATSSPATSATPARAPRRPSPWRPKLVIFYRREDLPPQALAKPSRQRAGDLGWHLALVGPANGQQLRLCKGASDQLDTIGQPARPRYRQRQGGQTQVIDGARIFYHPRHRRLQGRAAADIEFGNGRQRVGKDRQNGDIDVLEGVLERAAKVGAARSQGRQMIDGANEMAELQPGAHLRTIVVGP